MEMYYGMHESYPSIKRTCTMYNVHRYIIQNYTYFCLYLIYTVLYVHPLQCLYTHIYTSCLLYILYSIYMYLHATPRTMSIDRFIYCMHILMYHLWYTHKTSSFKTSVSKRPFPNVRIQKGFRGKSYKMFFFCI